MVWTKRARWLTVATSVTVSAALMIGATGCGSDDGGSGGGGAKAGGGSIVVANWGGTDDDGRKQAFYPTFTQSTGTKVVDVAGPMDYGKVKAMVDAGRPQWDIAATAPSLYYTLGDKYFEKIDYDKNPGVWEGVINTTPYAAPEHVGCEAMVYKKSAFPNGGPKTWADFWDTTRFPGKRALGADGGVPWFTLEAAVMAGGVDPKSVYPVDYDLAFAQLTKLRDTGDLKIWSSYANGAQMMASGQVTMARIPPSAAWELFTSGEWAVNWNNAICWTEAIHIIKGTPNYGAALKYAEWIVDPKRQAEFATTSHSGPVNPKAFDFISSDLRDLLPVPPDVRDSVVWEDYDWYGKSYNDLVKRWNKWRLAA